MKAFVHLIWILPLALLVIYIGSPRFLGTMGFARARRLLDRALERRRFTVFHDVTLPGGGGTVHIDHVVISRFGIHIIDNEHRAGWISGTEAQARWRQKLRGRFHTFDNPVHANHLRVQALERLLHLPPSRFHSLVVMSGHRGFRGDVPRTVIGMGQLIGRIRSGNRPLLSAEEADQAVLALQGAMLKPALPGARRRWMLLRLALFAALCVGVALVYGEPIRAFLHELQRQANIRMAPEKYHANGQPKSATELWEDTLICAWSSDTGRCSCYEPDGQKARLDASRCRELAQRGSVLEQ